MPFSKFEGTGSGRGRSEGAPQMVSLRKSKSIGLNQATLDAHFDGKDGAIMYYDEDQNMVGIEPVADPDGDEAAYTVTKSKSSGTIAPSAFLERYDLVPDVTTQYDPKWDDVEQLLVIDIDDPKQTYGESDDE